MALEFPGRLALADLPRLDHAGHRCRPRMDKSAMCAGFALEPVEHVPDRSVPGHCRRMRCIHGSWLRWHPDRSWKVRRIVRLFPWALGRHLGRGGPIDVSRIATRRERSFASHPAVPTSRFRFPVPTLRWELHLPVPRFPPPPCAPYRGARGGVGTATGNRLAEGVGTSREPLGNRGGNRIGNQIGEGHEGSLLVAFLDRRRASQAVSLRQPARSRSSVAVIDGVSRARRMALASDDSP